MASKISVLGPKYSYSHYLRSGQGSFPLKKSQLIPLLYIPLFVYLGKQITKAPLDQLIEVFHFTKKKRFSQKHTI